MKKTLTKILVCFLVFLILFNFTLASDAYNANISAENIPAEGGMGASVAENAFNTIYNLLMNSLGAFVGFMTWGFRIAIFAILAGVQVIISGIVSLGGVTASGIMVTPFTIFFNQVPLLDVDFMSFDSPSSAVNDFRTQVATWYYILRIIAAAILLLILIYIGIRMAISTMAQDKVVYKKTCIEFHQNEDGEDMVKGVITSFNFEDFQTILSELFISNTEKEGEFNPANEAAKKIAEKLQQARNKKAKKEAKSSSIFGIYTSILATGLQMDINTFFDYKPFQLYDAFSRFLDKQAYDMYQQAMSIPFADTSKLKENEPKNWMRDLYV